MSNNVTVFHWIDNYDNEVDLFRIRYQSIINCLYIYVS